MATTIQSILDLARVPLNDKDKLRYTDAEMLTYFNDALKTLCQYRSDLFFIIGDIPCNPGTTDQTLPAGGIAVVDIMSIKGGAAIDRTDIDTMRSFNPNWRTDTAAAAQNWMYAPGDPAQQSGADFEIYPKAPNNQILTGQYIKAPTTYAIGDVGENIPVGDTYGVALQAYIVFRAESKNDESVDGGRAALFLQGFLGQIGAANTGETIAP